LIEVIYKEIVPNFPVFSKSWYSPRNCYYHFSLLEVHD